MRIRSFFYEITKKKKITFTLEVSTLKIINVSTSSDYTVSNDFKSLFFINNVNSFENLIVGTF